MPLKELPQAVKTDLASLVLFWDKGTAPMSHVY
jgi:hypothetical protein